MATLLKCCGFRGSWPSVVAPRIVTGTSCGNGSVHASIRNSICISAASGQATSPPGFLAPSTRRGLSDALRNLSQAICICSQPVIETRRAVSSSSITSVMSDQALSIAALKFVSFLLVLGVAVTTSIVVAWTCLLEVVGAIWSKIVACHGGHL